MLRISDEIYESVQAISEDIGYCCAVDDDYNEWEDIAASSMSSFLDELAPEQLEMTVSALEEYIIDTADSNINMAMGIKTALERYFRERLEFLDIYVVPDVKMNLDEDDIYDDTDVARLINVLTAMQTKVEKIQIGE